MNVDILIQIIFGGIVTLLVSIGITKFKKIDDKLESAVSEENMERYVEKEIKELKQDIAQVNLKIDKIEQRIESKLDILTQYLMNKKD